MIGDFHIHTTYSDGVLSIREVVDLYGKAGFKALAITDHVCEEMTFLGKAALYLEKTLTKESFQSYLAEIEIEADRARVLYDMTLIPGVEITKNSLFNHRSAHIVILGIEKWISPDLCIYKICEEAKSQGALTIAAHPVFTRNLEKQTYHLWDRKEELKKVVDLWEVASGKLLFPEVQGEKLPKIANSDLHRAPHITSWKTKVFSEKKQECILDALRRQKVDFVYYQEQSSLVQTRTSSLMT